VKKKRSRGVEEADGEQRQEAAKKARNNPGNLMRFLTSTLFWFWFCVGVFPGMWVCVCVGEQLIFNGSVLLMECVFVVVCRIASGQKV